MKTTYNGVSVMIGGAKVGVLSSFDPKEARPSKRLHPLRDVERVLVPHGETTYTAALSAAWVNWSYFENLQRMADLDVRRDDEWGTSLSPVLPSPLKWALAEEDGHEGLQGHEDVDGRSGSGDSDG